MDLEDLYRLLRTGHVQAQGIVDTLEAPLLVLDQALCVLSGNQAFFETFQVSKDETLGQRLFDLGDGQWDIPDLRQLLSQVVPKSAAVVGYEVRHDFPQLGQKTMLVSARRLVHQDSSSSSILVLFEDVTEQRRHEAEKDILLAETRHRMKNLLATVRALASRTATEGRSAAEFRSAFLGRFQALMDAQDVTLSGQSTADFADIVARAAKLAPANGAFIYEGPSVTVPAPKVLALNLVLHELSTNALKYGALSEEGRGKVVARWSVDADGKGKTLRFEWREESGPAVAAPARRGFGSDLIEFSVKQDLTGTAELHFDPEGFRGVFTLPIG
jgi:two-component sensor histidine kinase